MADQNYFVHESSYVDDGAEVGTGTRIWHFCHVLKGSKIGTNCIFGQNCMIGPDVRIGNRCKFQNNISIYTGVTIEDDVFCGPSCVFTNVYNPRAFIERKHEFKPTLVRQGATIGANATIVCGAVIGRNALVAAGSVVKKDVPDYAVVAGVPARQIGWVCKCGTSLQLWTAGSGRQISNNSRRPRTRQQTQEIACKYCSNRYELRGGRLLATEEVDNYGPVSTGNISE